TVVRDTLRTTRGCDSIYKVAAITIQNISPVTQAASYFGCNNNGKASSTDTSSTVVRDTLRTTRGCDSIYKVATITIQNISPVTQAASYFGCNSYVYNGTTYTSSTVVRDTLRTTRGCDSIYKVAAITIENISPVTQAASYFGCN